MINFKNKKITIMGLGLLGRGVGDAEFLAKEGVDLVVTDLKSAYELKPSLDRLKKFKNIKYTLGKHKAEDFKARDFILRGAGVPKDSKYLKIAKKNKIPVVMDDSWFAELARERGCKIIGVTGTRGKTTVATWIYQALKIEKKKEEKRKEKRTEEKKVYLAGNVLRVATLPLIKKVKKDDLVVLELSSWQLQGWDEAKISPHISVITNIYPDHLNYYKGNMRSYINDKKVIYKYQGKDDFLILNKDNKYSREFRKEAESKVCWFNKKDVLKSWKLNLFGEHNLENLAAVITVLNVRNVKNVRNVVESLGGVEHRLELTAEIGGAQFINDTTSTTPVATQKALGSFDSPIILIAGGSDKGLSFKKLARDIKKNCKAVVLLKGNGTEKIKKELSLINYKLSKEYSNLTQAVKKAKSLAEKGDVILFSPACTSFGMFVNEYNRGDKFKKIVKTL